MLLRPSSLDSGIDRKALAGLLVDLARNVRPDLSTQSTGVSPVDQRLEQLRTLLLGQEIETLSRLSEVVEDPEQFAVAVGRILPTAIAQASGDARLGQVLAPALERATQSSIRNNPGTLVNILYPLIVPAIRKSIGETIDETFQSLNESLKHSLSWRGLRWRWEAWRTGSSFAEVVLRHTLVYQVEHVFLIHRHTGLLISHVTASNASSQDPQLVSSMLVAIQDFVRDSFSGAEQQGLDTLRLGELRLWSEPGPFATLVAVIRGNPPEGLHDTLRDVLSRIHAARPQALENFDGDSSGFADVEAQLTECVALGQRTPLRARKGFPWLIALIGLAVVLLIGAWGVQRWRDDRLWDNYIASLRAQPGIVIAQSGRRDGNFAVTGLRDPLAVDPGLLLSEAGIEPSRVVALWTPYQGLDPEIVLRRLRSSLNPPPEVTLAVEGERIVARGSAQAVWLERARIGGSMLPAGSPVLDLSGVRNTNEEDERLWAGFIAGLRTQPGIVITEQEQRDGKFLIAGLRDPLAADPRLLLSEAGIEPSRVVAHWAPYQALDPEIVLQRLLASLDAPPGVTVAVEGDRIVARGSASSLWLEHARIVARTLPVGAPAFDLSAMRDINDGVFGKLREAIQSRTILFNNNEPLPTAAQEPILDQLAGELKELASLSSGLRVSTRVTLTGHSDSVGKGTFNLSLSVARAEVVRALLKKRGVNPDLLAVRGAGPLEPLEAETSELARSADRRVSLTVDFDERREGRP